MSLSCIVQTLWDMCKYQVIIEATVPHLDKHGCNLEQKHFIKMKRDIGLLMT